MLNANENVLSCCVVGIDNEELGYGSIPIANIVLKNKELEDVTIKELYSSCKKELGNKYQPNDIIALDELPLTDVGKVDYRKIQEMDKNLKKVKRR